MAFKTVGISILLGWKVPRGTTITLPIIMDLWWIIWKKPCGSCEKVIFRQTLFKDFSIEIHLNARDGKAVRRAASGLVKILHPRGYVSAEDIEEIVTFVIEACSCVKE
jgi:hypothetical protein